MLDNLTQRFGKIFKNIRGQTRLSEDNIKDALREVRLALLEADVALPIVKDFVNQVKERALGSEIADHLTPDQAFFGIVNEALVELMGKENSALNLSSQPPAVVLMAGLQGAGKTTTVGKLARLINEQDKKKKILLVSADVYRPAAIEQLRLLSEQVKADFFPSDTSQKPVEIALAAQDYAKKHFYDVLMVDTAGRLAIDQEMMDEIQAIHAAVNPVETLFVVDAMLGQDAVNTAQAFNEALPLTGVVLTKMDGDSRGGAALSVRQVTGKPIKFLGVGEKTEALEAFHPDRIASRILGMGDVLGLIEDLEHQVDEAKARKLATKMAKGKTFDLDDFREQLHQMQLIDMDKMLEKIPGMGNIPQAVKDQHLSPKKIRRQEAIIQSMTMQERRNPDIIKGSRKRRIAAGAGVDVPEVNRLLKQFKEMQNQMKKFRSSKMLRMLGAAKGAMPMGKLPFK